jgi:hypothetical protein
VDRKILFTPVADGQLTALEHDRSMQGVCRAVKKALSYLETNPKHPGLKTHEYSSLAGMHGERVFEAYAQNDTPGAFRIFWHYGPDEVVKGKRIPVITIVAITAHP